MRFADRGCPLKIRFWGVRGSIPTPGETQSQTGGNTACVVLEYADEPPVIIDGGTGLRVFGQQVVSNAENPFQATLLFSHFHWDHIQGFPFFGPIYSKHTQLKMWAGVPARDLEQVLATQMGAPFFPVPFGSIAAGCEFHRIEASGFSCGSLHISPITLNHPGSATGFRIDSPNGSVTYVSDHEHGVAAIDEQIADKAYESDLMIYDAHFTPQEYPNFKGWGHSTWEEGARLAVRANIKKLALFHHSPGRTDEQMKLLVANAQTVLAETYAATELHDFILPAKEALIVDPKR